MLPLLSTVHTVIVAGDGDTGGLDGAGVRVLRYADVLAGHPARFDWPDVDENSAGGDVLHQRDHRQPAKVLSTAIVRPICIR